MRASTTCSSLICSVSLLALLTAGCVAPEPPAVPQPVRSPDELCLTANARRNRDLRVSCQVHPPNASTLVDGSHADTHSLAWRGDGAITFTFAERILPSRVEIIYHNDPTNAYTQAERVRAACMLDGQTVASSDWIRLDDEPRSLCGRDGIITPGAQAAVHFPTPVLTDALQLRVDKMPHANQALVREVLVWGIPDSLASTGSQPGASIVFSAAENTYSSLKVSWDSVPADTAYVRVSYRETGRSEWSTACFSRSPGLLHWLTPDTAYEVTAEAMGPAYEKPWVRPQVVRLPHPLANRSVCDILGMNFRPSGAGARQQRENETENTLQMLRLMRDAHVRHVRWPEPSAAGAELAMEAGMSYLSCPAFERPDACRYLPQELGSWLISTASEPDLANIEPARFTERFKPVKAAAGRISPLLLLAGPTPGSNLVGPGADYLTRCYQGGLKDAIHVLDVHPYTTLSTPAVAGGYPGGPEGVLHSMTACKQVMTAFDDAGRPVIVSEVGHPTHECEWFMPACSYGRQAQWLVRTHLLLMASGLRRIYWYGFQDEGTDRQNPNHSFGIVDWHGRPKPAYVAYRTMAQLLGKATCAGLMRELHSPAYGVRFRLGDRHVTALWDCGGKGELRLAGAPQLERILSIDGDPLPWPVRRGKFAVLPIDESVRYVFSRKPLLVVAHRRLAPSVEPLMYMTLEPATVPVTPGEDARWAVKLGHDYPCPVDVELACPSPWRTRAFRKRTTVAPGETRSVPVFLNVPINAATPRLVPWIAHCTVRPRSEEYAGQNLQRDLFLDVR